MKSKPHVVTLKFHGTDLELTNVRVISVVGEALPFMHVEQKGKGWQIILNNSPITELLATQDKVVIRQETVSDLLRILTIEGEDAIELAVTKAARINVDHKFLHVDCMITGEYRLNYSPAFIETTADITHLEIIKD